MMRCSYEVELVCDGDDDFLEGSAVVGLAHRHEDGTIDLMLRAHPVNGARLRLVPLPEAANRELAAAAVEYRKARARSER